MSIAPISTSITARAVYDPGFRFGMTHEIDRVVVEWTTPDEEPDDIWDYVITVLGWRLTSKGVRDKRQQDREYVAIGGRVERDAFVREELGIDYKADIAALLAPEPKQTLAVEELTLVATIHGYDGAGGSPGPLDHHDDDGYDHEAGDAE